MLSGKKILVGVSGSIAAYKTVLLVRALKKNKAEVKVVMTSSASDFIGPLTLSTVSGNPVYSKFADKNSGELYILKEYFSSKFFVVPGTIVLLMHTSPE